MKLLTLAIAGFVVQGTQTSLGDYVKSLDWKPAKQGALLYLDPKGSAAHRMKVQCGTVTALVPDEMVLIDASLTETPNLYEGLPRTDKVVYLMSTMSEAQWQKANQRAISMDDLTGEQKLVMKSILPKRFVYTIYKPVEGTQGFKPVDTELSPDEIKQIGLHFFRGLSFTVHLMNEDGFTGASVPVGVADVSRNRDADGDDKDSLFGVKIRSVVPNKLKPSDLSYKDAALNKLVDVAPGTNLGQVLETVSAAVNVPLVADVRAATHQVGFMGGAVRAGDLLQGIALSVTGTFRKVGRTFVLTSDIAGMGERRARIAYWNDEVTHAVQERLEGWFRQAGKLPGYKRLGYEAKDPNTPNDNMRKWMSDHATAVNPEGISLQELPQNLQDILKHDAENVAKTQPIRIDHVIPDDQIFWNFVLPDGRQVQWESSIGSDSRFSNASSYDWKAAPFKAIKAADVSAKAPQLVLKATDKESAIAAVGAAKSHGFAKLWLQTTQSDCLAAAIAAGKQQGIPVGLMLHPFEIAEGGDQDRTILGDTAPQAAIRRDASVRAELAFDYMGFPRDAAPPSMAPLDPRLMSRWTMLAKLCHQPGLAGVGTTDTQSTGYEPTAKNSQYGFFDLTFTMSQNLGYSTAMREHFLLDHHVDPIDIENLWFFSKWRGEEKIDFTYPQFTAPPTSPREFTFDESMPDGAARKWNALKHQASEDAVKGLLEAIGRPVFVERRRLIANMPPSTPLSSCPGNRARCCRSFKACPTQKPTAPPEVSG